MNGVPLLETQALSVQFGAVVAVNQVSVRIDAGEVVGLIGTNGAGKTTFLNMVTGYLRPSSGRVLLEGRDTLGQGPRELVAHGMARSFQVPQLFPEMTVREHILLSLALARSSSAGLLRSLRSKASEAEASAVLQRFGLMAIAERAVSGVPQGQRKLIDIAMALALKPKLLLLDEPTSGVSSAEKMPLMEVVFDAIRSGGVTVLFVEHDMDVVRQYVTRILAFRDGCLIADGSPDAVMNDPTVASVVLRRPIPGAAQ
jgi:branched-chain amino acid transport system ATP-binding protein